ncbi:MAG TPA: hypothetical protein VHM64_18575 [Candidatus Binatia bacterium]|nr:hypothetical protein [Candidatus Binatia bacterium]
MHEIDEVQEYPALYARNKAAIRGGDARRFTNFLKESENGHERARRCAE